MSKPGGKKTTVTETILSIIKLIGKGTVSFIELSEYIRRHQYYMLSGGLDYILIKKLEDEKYRKKVISNLKYKKRLKTNYQGKNLFITLNNPDKIIPLAKQLLSAKPRTDGLKTLVIFDIPESKRMIRDQFRYLLKTTCFKKLQQSVWLSQKDVYQTIIKFSKEHRAQNWINVLLVKNIWHD